jgi:ribose-phosphate pyrophosphokinase
MAKIIAGSACSQLVNTLCQNLDIAKIDTYIERYQDQELRVQLSEGAYNEDVIIVQSTSKPANDHLMELFLLVDAAKRSGARQVIAVLPYFGYSRQDRPSYAYGPISARLVANLLEASKVDHLITIDLHSPQIEGFFKINVQNIETTTLFASSLKDKPNLTIVSPDIGGLIRARKLSGLLNTNLAVISKIRKNYNTCEMDGIMGDVSGAHCVLIDDIVDTGNTLCQAAELLMKNGALSVEAFATHAVLSEQAINNISNSTIDKMVVTNSISQSNLGPKFKVIDIAALLAENLKKFSKPKIKT